MSNQKTDLTTLAVNREKTIVRTSVIGIVTNVFLAAFKAAIGLISNSIAVTLDAVNNLSDAMSSVITIIGAKLGATGRQAAGQKASSGLWQDRIS